MGWSLQNVIARIVEIIGANDGLFVYNSSLTVLKSSDTGSATHDPNLSIACPEGFATYNTSGKVISLLSTANKAFFQYADAGASQGQLISSLSSTGGTDPVAGFNYNAGLYGLDPVGGNITVAGPVISFGEIPYTRGAQIKPVIASDNAHRPYLLLDAPEETTANHLQMLMTGESPDATKSPQLIIGVISGSGTPLISAGSANVLEVQGDQVIGPGFGQPGIIRSVAPGGGAVESWHAMTLQNSWVNTGGSDTPAEYRLEPDNSVWLAGDISSGTITDGTQIAAALPSAYFPAHTQFIFLGTANATTARPNPPILQISTAGVITVANLGTGTTRIVFNGKYKLDA